MDGFTDVSKNVSMYIKKVIRMEYQICKYKIFNDMGNLRSENLISANIFLKILFFPLTYIQTHFFVANKQQ